MGRGTITPDKIPSEYTRQIIDRLYSYLKRFRDLDRLTLDIFFVMSKIIYNDESHQDILRKVVFRND